MKIAVIGTGYVGLTTGACLAALEHNVTCFDTDSAKISGLNQGRLPIFEPGLAEIVETNQSIGRLAFVDEISPALRDAELVFIAVGTPSGREGDVDLRFVEQAARDAAPHLAAESVLVIKSTVPAGTAAHVRDLISTATGRKKISVASNPEFLREGSAIEDFFEPDRIVIGTDDNTAAARLQELYAPFLKRGVPTVMATTVDAELIKYAANAFLALKIGFINQVADLCERTQADIVPVARGIGLDRRIGSAFLAPGPGYGGSCFPKDTRAFAATGRRHGAPQTLVETLVKVNEARKVELAERICAAFGGRLAGRRITVLGTAFKANTDDMREAAALTIVPILQRRGALIRAHDPQGRRSGETLLPDVEWIDDPYSAAGGADAVVILTEWRQYASLNCRRLAQGMNGRLLIDYRNLLAPDEVVRAGLTYVSLGRAASPAPYRSSGRRNSAGADWRDIAASPL